MPKPGSYTNSEGEQISIQQIAEGDYQGQLILVIHDDWPGLTQAPHLLDEGTVKWLLESLQQPTPQLIDL